MLHNYVNNYSLPSQIIYNTNLPFHAAPYLTISQEFISAPYLHLFSFPCVSTNVFLNVPNNSLCGCTHKKYVSSLFLWNLLFLASVWIGCFLGPDAYCPSMTFVLKVIFLLPFLLNSMFSLSVPSWALVESTILLFHEKMCRRGKTLFACLEIYLMLLKHSIDCVSRDTILGWKTFSFKIL